ncbi:MAG: hypothetical protein ABJG15_05645 [Hyphomonadaceae bacterium]
MNDDELESVQRAVRLINSRGHAGAFAKKTREDQISLEKLVAIEWTKSAQVAFGLNVSSLEHNLVDPPDCFAEIDGRKIAIELTELVNSNLLDDIETYNRENGLRVTSADRFYHHAQWNLELFKTRLDERIDKKQESYEKRGIFVDVLVVHSDEPWLSPYHVETWISSLNFKARPNLFSVHFIQSYFPGYSKHWPIFRLY